MKRKNKLIAGLFTGAISKCADPGAFRFTGAAIGDFVAAAYRFTIRRASYGSTPGRRLLHAIRGCRSGLFFCAGGYCNHEGSHQPCLFHNRCFYTVGKDKNQTKIYQEAFLAITFSAAATISGVSRPYFLRRSTGLPLSPKVSWVPTYSIGMG